MNKKRYLSLFLILLGMLFVIEDAHSQRRGKKKRRTTEKTERKQVDETSWKQNLAYEIGFGNPTFFGGNTSVFNIALKPGIAYKLHDRISVGLALKGDYVWANDPGFGEFTLFDFGVGAFTRFKIVDQFYTRFEYNRTRYQRWVVNPQFNTGEIVDFPFYEPMAGLGYIYSGNNWNFGIEYNFHLNRDLRTTLSRIGEFWFKADYNF